MSDNIMSNNFTVHSNTLKVIGLKVKGHEIARIYLREFEISPTISSYKLLKIAF